MVPSVRCCVEITRDVTVVDTGSVEVDLVFVTEVVDTKCVDVDLVVVTDVVEDVIPVVVFCVIIQAGHITAKTRSKGTIESNLFFIMFMTSNTTN